MQEKARVALEVLALWAQDNSTISSDLDSNQNSNISFSERDS
jgi:hypothetical protein